MGLATRAREIIASYFICSRFHLSHNHALAWNSCQASFGRNRGNLLRTVPTIVIALTFCASRDTRISYRRCLLIQGYFCAVQNYVEKAEFSKSSWYPKRKLGVKSNAVRALGNFLRYIRTASLDKPGFAEAVEKAVQALLRNVGFGLMKVRWNACYAVGNLFRNPCLPTGSAPWTGEIFNALENVICDCKNFKVRINAVIALSVPPERRYYGDVYSHVYATLIDALKNTEKVTEFSEFKYRDTLRQQLCNSLCHMTILMTAEDLVCLHHVLEKNHETYKRYIREYIRQLHIQELPVEDQTLEKTTAEKLSSLHEARRRIHEEFETSSGAVYFLKDVFGAICDSGESGEEISNTELSDVSEKA